MDWFQTTNVPLSSARRTVGNPQRSGSTPDAIIGHKISVGGHSQHKSCCWRTEFRCTLLRHFRVCFSSLWERTKVVALVQLGIHESSNDGMVKIGYPREHWIWSLFFHCKSNSTHETQEGSTNHNLPLCWGQTPHLCQRHGSQQPCGALPRLAAGAGSQCQREVPCCGILVPLMMATHAVQGEEEMTWFFGRAKLVDS